VQLTFLNILTIIFTVCLSTRSYAEIQLHESRTWRRAKLIAPGQQVWSFQSSYQKTSSRFTGTGTVEPLGRRYSRSVTWGQILNSESNLVRRQEIEKYMRDQGVGSGDVAARSTYDLEREDVGLSADWAYGLTRSWMIGFQVPVVMRTTMAKTNTHMVSTLRNGVAARAFTQTDMPGKVQELAENQLREQGYDSIPEHSQEWAWGDISLLSQFYLYHGYTSAWSLQQMVRFPSSRNPSVSDYFYQNTDEGQVDGGLSSLLDVQIKRWIFGLRFGYVAQFADSAKMRGEDGIDPKVNRDLGDWIWGSVDTDYQLGRRWTLGMEYAFLTKSADKYSGNSLRQEDYEILSKDTDQEVHQTHLAMQYDFSDRTVRRGVENKWSVALGYTYPWSGRNSLDSSRTSLELISYF
jgi:hypothetical protein